MQKQTPDPGEKRSLVTGAAGFIGFHLCRRLLQEGWTVLGIDNLNSYYDISLKEARLQLLTSEDGFDFKRIDISDGSAISSVFSEFAPPIVINLAAQAGVHYSLDHPNEYVQSNLVGFANILEACRQTRVRHLLFASSSSVYGANRATPSRTSMNVDHPLSLYAATKKANELMAHSYAHLYDIPTSGLRFFTVYGPWGRPDMACYLFTKSILAGKPIKVFNNGDMYRDFTFIDDAVESAVRLIKCIPESDDSWDGHNPDPSSSSACFRVYNIGNGSPVKLSDFIDALEAELGVSTAREFYPMHPADIEISYADVGDLASLINYSPSTPISEGLKQFVAWYREFHREA